MDTPHPDSETSGLIFFKPSGGPRGALGGYAMLAFAVMATVALCAFGLLSVSLWAWNRDNTPPPEELVLPLPDGVSTLSNETHCTQNSEPFCERTLIVESDLPTAALVQLLADHFAKRGWELDGDESGLHGIARTDHDAGDVYPAIIAPEPPGAWSDTAVRVHVETPVALCCED